MQESSTKDFDNLCGVDPLVNIFKDLIVIDTKSDPVSKTVPSTVGQLRMGAYLISRISELGYSAKQDENGVVTVAVDPSEGCENAKSLCLLSHMDTAPDCSGSDVKAHLVRNYQGGAIKLENGLILDSSVCRDLYEFKGQDIIVTDGNTLLGADDKAGISVLLYLLHNLKVNRNLKHGPLKIIFSVDEEIGLSSTHLDVRKIDCDYGVTVDGTKEGELDTATFNAYGAIVNFKGLSVHTAVAYKTLKNAILMAHEFISMLPSNEKPENTMGEEGFYHVHKFEGTTESSKINMIIRDFTKNGMEKRLNVLNSIVSFLNDRYGKGSVSMKTVFQYANMEQVLNDHGEILEILRKAYTEAGVKVVENKVRGGTDGSNLSNEGLPTPNIFTGALNCHGPYECLPVNSFNMSYRVTEKIVELMSRTQKS